MKTKKIILTLALGSLMIWPATAQNSRRNAQKQRVQQMKEIVKELDLDDNQTALDSLSPAPANRGKNREKQEELTEEQASEKLTQQLNRELQRATLKKEFCEKLQKNGFTSVQILKIINRRPQSGRNNQQFDSQNGGFMPPPPGGGFPGGF